MGTLTKEMGTQNLKKVPMGTRVPKWGPTWEQCSHLLEIAVLPVRLRKLQERAADLTRAAFMGQDLTGVHSRNQLPQIQTAKLLPQNVHQV